MEFCIIIWLTPSDIRTKVRIVSGSSRNGNKYATGKTWYGTEHLFGPETIYSEADKTFIFARKENGYSGYTIELILQQFGNLRTQKIQKSEW